MRGEGKFAGTFSDYFFLHISSKNTMQRKRSRLSFSMLLWEDRGSELLGPFGYQPEDKHDAHERTEPRGLKGKRAGACHSSCPWYSFIPLLLKPIWIGFSVTCSQTHSN